MIQEQVRIDAGVVQADAPVKVRSSNSPGLTHIPKILPLIDSLAYLNANAAHMAVHGDQSLAVINQHSIAIEEVITCGDNSSSSW